MVGQHGGARLQLTDAPGNRIAFATQTDDRAAQWRSDVTVHTYSSSSLTLQMPVSVIASGLQDGHIVA